MYEAPMTYFICSLIYRVLFYVSLNLLRLNSMLLLIELHLQHKNNLNIVVFKRDYKRYFHRIFYESYIDLIHIYFLLHILKHLFIQQLVVTTNTHVAKVLFATG